MHGRWRLFALATALAMAVAFPATVAGAQVGYRNQFTEARVFYRTTATWDPCVQLNLVMGLREETSQQLAPGTTPHALITFAWAFYEPVNTCTGTSGPRFEGSTPLDADHYTVNGLDSASVRDVLITVSDGLDSLSYSFNFDWVGNHDVKPFIVLNGTLAWTPHVGFAPGYHWIERYVTAQATSTAANDPFPYFDQGDMWLAEIGQGTELVNPRP